MGFVSKAFGAEAVGDEAKFIYHRDILCSILFVRISINLKFSKKKQFLRKINYFRRKKINSWCKISSFFTVGTVFRRVGTFFLQNLIYEIIFSKDKIWDIENF